MVFIFVHFSCHLFLKNSIEGMMIFLFDRHIQVKHGRESRRVEYGYIIVEECRKGIDDRLTPCPIQPKHNQGES